MFIPKLFMKRSIMISTYFINCPLSSIMIACPFNPSFKNICLVRIDVSKRNSQPSVECNFPSLLNFTEKEKALVIFLFSNP
jgi:hypothetical protein